MTKRARPKIPGKKKAAPASNGADKDAPDIKELSIQSRPVFVGDCLLTLREPGYCTLIEISETLLSDNLAENVKKLTGLAKGAFDGIEVEAPKQHKTTSKIGSDEHEVNEEVPAVIIGHNGETAQAE